MTSTQLKWIAVALAAAVVLWLGAELFTGKSDTVEQGALIGEISQESIDTVTFAKADSTVRLVRSADGTWQVNGFKAEPASITHLFEAFDDARTGELVAQSASSHERMGVGDTGATRVTVQQGDDTVLQLLVGKSGRQYGSVFVRSAGQDPVYLVKSDLGTFAGRSVNQWRDKRIATVDTSQVQTMSVERGSDRYTLSRDSTHWVLGDGSPTDSSHVVRMLGGFASLTATGDGFATAAQVDSADFDRPERAVTLLGGSGDTLASLVFDSTASGFWVRPRDGGTVYTLFRWKVDDIVPADSVIRKKE